MPKTACQWRETPRLGRFANPSSTSDRMILVASRLYEIFIRSLLIPNSLAVPADRNVRLLPWKMGREGGFGKKPGMAVPNFLVLCIAGLCFLLFVLVCFMRDEKHNPTDGAGFIRAGRLVCLSPRSVDGRGLVERSQ